MEEDLKKNPIEGEDEYMEALSDSAVAKPEDTVKTVEPKKVSTEEQSPETSASKAQRAEEKPLEIPESRPWHKKILGAPAYWWRHKRLRYGSLAVLLLILACASLVPNIRYAALNLVGARVRMSTYVVDSQTGLPLENIPVSLQGIELRTDEDGFVAFTELKLGESLLLIEKSGYARYENDVVLGWGSNPLKNQELVATGTQFRFVLTDWLSGVPIAATEDESDSAEARSGEDIAVVDDMGVIVLTVGELEPDSTAAITASGYRTEVVDLSQVDGDVSLQLVPERPHVFVSNRDGVYDLYKSDVDGKNEEVVLKATGKEREIPHAVVQPNGNQIAYISTRDGEANSDGFIYDGLFLVDVRSGTSNRIVRSEQIQVIGWSGDRLIYTAVTEGVSGNNPQRSQLFSFDISTGEKLSLASSNYFNDVQLSRDTVYYSVSSFAVAQSEAKLFSISADGQNKKTVIDSQVWTIVQSTYDTLHFQAVDSGFKTVWYTKQGEAEPQKLDAPPVTQQSRSYATSPEGGQALRVDERDGKGVLIMLDVESGNEEVLQTAPGLSQPVYWLDIRSVVYRVVNSQESADYVVSLAGGEPRKIADVVGNQSRYFY